jgi:hypothetical protein
MAVLQTTILENPSAGQNGHIAASTAGQGETLVRLADANIGVGLFMCEGATAGVTAKAPASAAEAKACIGCSIDPEYLNEIGAAADYLDGDAVTLLQKGYIWVNVEGTCVHDGKVCVRHTSDGGDNTTLGKASAVSDYPAGGIIATPVAVVASDSNHYSLTLYDGTVRETYSFNTDVTPSAQELVEGLAALINAGTAFDATEDNSALSITSVSGILEVDGGAQFVLTAPARCAVLKGARFVKGRTGAGLVKVRLQLRQDF